MNFAKDLTILNTEYTYTAFKDGSIHVPEDNQDDFLYWALRMLHFIHWVSVCFSSMNGLFDLGFP